MHKKEIKNSALLLAATEEFIEKGLESAVMENIAKRAEVSKRTLYKYYPTKEELYSTIVEDLFNSVRENLKYDYDFNKSVDEMLDKILIEKLELVNNIKFIKLSKLLTLEQIRKSKPDPKVLQKFFEGHNQFEHWVQTCQKDNKLTKKSSPSEMAEYFHGLFDGMILWPLIIGIKKQFSPKEQVRLKNVIKESFLSLFKLK